MDNQQQHAPPSAGSLDTFVSAVQDAGGDTGTPNSIPIPRNLFNRFPQLPRYLTANASIPLSLDHVAAEEEDAGAEGDDDSVESADEANELTESMIEANLERLEDLDDCVEFSEANAIKDLKDMASVPQPPSEYVPPAVKTEKGEPKFEELDNPGDWSRYCFNSSFNKSGSYISHSLPTGAVPVPWTMVCDSAPVGPSFTRIGRYRITGKVMVCLLPLLVLSSSLLIDEWQHNITCLRKNAKVD
ncbi:hypothetical protein IV203_025048 [Nitzschia inconspicua]|uniref:Uncharacterized protein n=1 Tax=Nitzschia inconspicua TaxID=303405 RepID=A0A9K3K400_9STRA|nr:hypothetical protein IV203_025048 [Nitzschia inconspicua]